MDEKETPDNYEVGYKKPPKSAQFKKGISGNPKGRSKKVLDFDHELLRESRKPVILNENGQRRRISKGAAVMKQLLNKAMSGNISALRTYLDWHRRASEKAALEEATQLEKRHVSDLDDDELRRMIADRKAKEQETKNGNISNAG